MAYKHVLAAVDLSEESAQVLDKARAQADQAGAKLSVVSVVKPLTQVYGGIDVAPLAGSAGPARRGTGGGSAAPRYDAPLAGRRRADERGIMRYLA